MGRAILFLVAASFLAFLGYFSIAGWVWKLQQRRQHQFFSSTPVLLGEIEDNPEALLKKLRTLDDLAGQSLALHRAVLEQDGYFPVMSRDTRAAIEKLLSSSERFYNR